MKYLPVVAKTRAPNGFHWKIDDYYHGESVYVKLCDSKDHVIGKITLDRLTEKPVPQYLTHSYLDHEYHGKGWGTKMYARAIQWCLERGYRVRSSGYSSENAKRVWKGKGIREKFVIRQRSNRHNNAYQSTSIHRQDAVGSVSLTTEDEIWDAYPKPADHEKAKLKARMLRKNKKTATAKRR